VFLALWGLGLGALVALFGWENDFTQMGWFFTKAALLTFGGAYAVLPYVIQGAVENYGWLSAPQMVDGLALGESTPGPLIMIVAFVGYVGGWTKQALGVDSMALAGILGACVATFFTFLPSFLFILAGGPLVERTRDDVKLTGPLTAITAAVVGVIANLALWFAAHVLFTNLGPFGVPQWSTLRPAPAVLTAVALLLMFALKWNLGRTLAVCALLGAATTTLG